MAYNGGVHLTRETLITPKCWGWSHVIVYCVCCVFRGKRYNATKIHLIAYNNNYGVWYKSSEEKKKKTWVHPIALYSCIVTITLRCNKNWTGFQGAAEYCSNMFLRIINRNLMFICLMIFALTVNWLDGAMYRRFVL
jgi:hypothetical protein